MFNAILLPVDGSALSFKPLRAVIDLARLSRARVVVLSVAEPRLYRSASADALESGGAAEALHLDAARHYVRQVQAAAEQAGVACESIVFTSVAPADDIVQTARRAHCDLIVMATRGRMGVLDTVFSESITQAVLQQSPVPVMVIP